MLKACEVLQVRTLFTLAAEMQPSIIFIGKHPELTQSVMTLSTKHFAEKEKCELPVIVFNE